MLTLLVIWDLCITISHNTWVCFRVWVLLCMWWEVQNYPLFIQPLAVWECVLSPVCCLTKSWKVYEEIENMTLSSWHFKINVHIVSDRLLKLGFSHLAMFLAKSNPDVHNLSGCHMCTDMSFYNQLSAQYG